jgi:hypothetical protein
MIFSKTFISRNKQTYISPRVSLPVRTSQQYRTAVTGDKIIAGVGELMKIWRKGIVTRVNNTDQ